MSIKDGTDPLLLKFATVFQNSMEQHAAYSGSDTGRQAMALKVGMCLIRYDLVRYLCEFETPDLPMYAKVRAYADAIRVMFEGKEWIEKKANIELRKICEASGLGACFYSTFAKRCKCVFKLSAIDKYANYRHTLSGHYDLNIAESLQKLCDIDAGTLQEDTKGFVEYLNQWGINLAEVFKFPKQPNNDIHTCWNGVQRDSRRR